MARFSTISSKGQITVPLEVRTRLGLKEGDRVEFILEEDRTTFRPARAPENPFAPFAGILAPMSREENIAWLRDLRDEDEASAQ